MKPSELGGRHEGFLLYRHRGSSSQMEIHPWGGGIHWQPRSEIFVGNAYPARFEYNCEAQGIYRAARNHVIFPETPKGLAMVFSCQEAIGE